MPKKNPNAGRKPLPPHLKSVRIDLSFETWFVLNRGGKQALKELIMSAIDYNPLRHRIPQKEAETLLFNQPHKPKIKTTKI